MYTNERRRVAQFCHIQRHQNRDNGLITNTPRCEIPAQITNILGIGDNSLSRTARNLTVNYHQCRTCIEPTDW
jgi:hypothetical protein